MLSHSLQSPFDSVKGSPPTMTAFKDSLLFFYRCPFFDDFQGDELSITESSLLSEKSHSENKKERFNSVLFL